jgi:hypothetical protein
MMHVARAALRAATLGAVLTMVCAAAALAQSPPPGAVGGGGPGADYTAEFKVQGYGPKLRGRVYGAPGKERRETADPWGGSTMIFRYDLGVGWVIPSSGPYYTEFLLRPPGTPVLPPGSVPPGLARIEDDDINDVPATKYAFPPTGTGPGGYVWLSREGIALRIDGQPQPGFPEIRFELDNLRYGPQNPALFELPAGYRKFSPQPAPVASGPPPAGSAPPGAVVPPAPLPPAMPQQGPVRVP